MENGKNVTTFHLLSCLSTYYKQVWNVHKEEGTDSLATRLFTQSKTPAFKKPAFLISPWTNWWHFFFALEAFLDLNSNQEPSRI